MVLSHTPRQVTQHVVQWLTHPVMLGISYLWLETILKFVEKMQLGMVLGKHVSVSETFLKIESNYKGSKSQASHKY